MRKIKGKYILIVLLLLLEIISLTFMYKSSHNKEIVLDEVSLKELLKSDMISIMTDETGNGTYTEYTTSNTFPSTNYIYNANKSQCINEKGDIVSGVLTFDGKKAVLTSNEGMHCTLYFDKTMSLGQFCKDETNMGTCISSKKSTIGKVENMTSSEVGDMYRYQGTNDVNNWICFGTNDKDECTKDDDAIDKYMYRIIGVTPDGQLALIKETGVKEGSTVYFQWNDKYITSDCGTNGENCTWKKSKIYNRLNGLCKTENSECNGTGEGTSGQTNIFINSTYYEYLNNNSEWLNKIDETHKWKYGDTKSNGSYDGDSAYAIENAFPNNVEAKIGLQYLHDYYYAYPGGNPGSSSNAKNAWIHLSKDGNSGITYEWLISRWGVNSTAVNEWVVSLYGVVSSSILNNYKDGVRPVFYLKSDIEISNTAGSKDDPFIIKDAFLDALPSCTIEVSRYGVSLVPVNADSWYLDTKAVSNPSYSTNESVLGLNTQTYYGYVKNSKGTGTCQLEMYQSKVYMCSVDSKGSATGTCPLKSSESKPHKCTVTSTGSNPGYYSCTGCNSVVYFRCNDNSVYDVDYLDNASCSYPGLQCKSSSENGVKCSGCEKCIPTGGGPIYECENGESYSSETDCTNADCPGTTYTCADNSTCTTSGCCSQKTCTYETYKCSDGSTYDNEISCLSKPCGSEACKAGYQSLGLASTAVFCYK